MMHKAAMVGVPIYMRRWGTNQSLKRKIGGKRSAGLDTQHTHARRTAAHERQETRERRARAREKGSARSHVARADANGCMGTRRTMGVYVNGPP